MDVTKSVRRFVKSMYLSKLSVLLRDFMCTNHRTRMGSSLTNSFNRYHSVDQSVSR